MTILQKTSIKSQTLTDRKLKIVVVKKLGKPVQSQFRNKINGQTEYFTKETETLRKNQIEILELKN